MVEEFAAGVRRAERRRGIADATRAGTGSRARAARSTSTDRTTGPTSRPRPICACSATSRASASSSSGAAAGEHAVALRPAGRARHRGRRVAEQLAAGRAAGGRSRGHASSCTRATSPTSRSCGPTPSTSRLATTRSAEVDDLDRVFRQVHRVLRPGAPFVFSLPTRAFALGRDDERPARCRSAARGPPLLLRPRADRRRRDGDERTDCPRTRSARSSPACTAPASGSTRCSSPSRRAAPTPGPDDPDRGRVAGPQRRHLGQRGSPCSRVTWPSARPGAVRRRPRRSGPRRGGPRAGSRAPRRRPARAATPRNSMTCVAVERGPDALSSSCRAARRCAPRARPCGARAPGPCARCGSCSRSAVSSLSSSSSGPASRT